MLQKLRKIVLKLKRAIEILHFKSSSWAHCLFSYTESLHSHGLLFDKRIYKSAFEDKAVCRREFENGLLSNEKINTKLLKAFN